MEGKQPATPKHSVDETNTPNVLSPTVTEEGTIRRNNGSRRQVLGGMSRSSTTRTELLRGDPEERSRPPRNYGTASSVARNRLASPGVEEFAAEGSRRPATLRRTSSNRPFRGQEFSALDDAREVENILRSRGSFSRSLATGSGRGSSYIRRRTTTGGAINLTLPRIDSHAEEGDEAERANSDNEEQELPVGSGSTMVENDVEEEQLGDDTTPQEDILEEDADGLGNDEEDDEGASDAESFTLRDKQTAINKTHPFGIRIWKPALYKKNRSVQQTAEGDIHSTPGGHVDRWLYFFNITWTLLFGWWLALITVLGAAFCLALGFAPGAADYGKVLWGLAGYLFYPFGKFVRLEQDDAYEDEDRGEGRPVQEYEQWQSGDIEEGRLFFGPTSIRGLIGRRRDSIDSGETESLLGRNTSGSRRHRRTIRGKRRIFGRGKWTLGRVVFFLFFYILIAPLLLTVSLLCWFMVFWIPMGRVTIILIYHLRKHPLALSFHSDVAYSRDPSSKTSILLCTYRAVGLKYWKYTVDGTNILLINLMLVVFLVIFDYWVLLETLHIKLWLTSPGFIFAMALFSIIPLAYFIGQAVASISAQSSMGLAATVNAFFSTLVEVFLYCVALNQGKGQLVEGSVIGSISAGILLMPGLSMCAGAFKRKTQRFNAKSTGVTSTMLLFAIIAAFSPTLFYQIYGNHELRCRACHTNYATTDCRRCFYTQIPAVNDRFYIEAVRPYTWLASVLLFFAYLVGLWFTLRTHAAVIWNTEVDEKKALATPAPNRMTASMIDHRSYNEHTAGHNSISTAQQSPIHRTAIKDSQLYRRILGQSLKQVGLPTDDLHRQASIITSEDGQPKTQDLSQAEIRRVSTADRGPLGETISMIDGLSEEQNVNLARQVAEIAATAAAVAARDATHAPNKTREMSDTFGSAPPRPQPSLANSVDFGAREPFTGIPPEVAPEGGGHDAPNWSRKKSTIILLGATILYAVIAEILVDTVDAVLASTTIDEKFLGITLFALVPNTTEFLNAISFAMNGNIALSMEIGSAYALQVCLLQIPALVAFSAFNGRFIDPKDLAANSFSLIFPQWDMVTIILCVFLLSYVYGEGKSNYFKGAILVLTYIVITAGFYLSGISDGLTGRRRFDVFGTEEYFSS